MFGYCHPSYWGSKPKGNLGSPYAIKDYRFIDPTLGTEEDFRHLVEEIHKRGMGIIMDVVYNHTSPDSLLAKEHPNGFIKTGLEVLPTDL